MNNLPKTAFRDGTRVKFVGYSWAGKGCPPNGTLGTVDNPKQSFLRAKGFTYVNWDDGSWSGVFTRELAKVR